MPQLLFRLNVISGNYKRIERFNFKYPNPLIQKLYRAWLSVTDFCVGFPRMWKMIKEMDCGNPERRPIKLAAVIIAKNESEYIAEWLAYHKAVGMEKVFLYDNDSDDNMHDILQPFIDDGFVVYHVIHGNKMQGIAYTDALHRYGKLCKYMAFIDGDELIATITPGESVLSILDRFFAQNPQAGGLAINWAMFGSSHYKDKPNGLMIESFIWRAEIGKPGTQMIKTILRPECALMYHHPHYPIYRLKYSAYNYFGEIVPLNESKITQYKGLQINHYFTKSKNQWIKRRKMGQCMTGIDKPRPMDDFYRHDNNDILDESAKRYAEKVKNIMEQYKKNAK